MRENAAPHRFGSVVLCAITHLPATDGYHAQRFDVVRTSLESMRDNASGRYDVVIWDNGSHNGFVEWLRDEYRPTVLVQSPNVGKSQARLGLLGMFTPETVVNIADDDIYYYPNWLQPQLQLLRHFPNVSCVTGYPVRTSFRWGNTETVKRITAMGAMVKRGKFIEDEWERDFAVSIGRDIAQHAEMTVKDMDILCGYNGVEAYLTSHHCQHVGRAGVLRVAALNTLMLGSMPDEKPYDIALDSIGNRLATVGRFTRHIGNVIDTQLARDIEEAEA